MALARLALLVLIASLIIDIASGSKVDALWTLVLIAAAFGPYVAVFAYQRHIVPILVMSGALLVFRRMSGIRPAAAYAPAAQA